MNKKLAPIVIGLILLGGLAYYLKTQPTQTGPQTTTQAMNEAAEFSKAMESGKPTTCTLAKGSDVMEYVISGKKMRANMTTATEGKTTLSHMIKDEAYVYSWVEGQAQGSKLALPTEEEVKAMADQAKESQEKTNVPKFDSAADYQAYEDQGYSINCRAGGVDDSLFTPPSTVTFIDPTAAMKQMTTPNGQIDYKKLQEQYAGMQQPGADGVEY